MPRPPRLPKEVTAYNRAQEAGARAICDLLAREITRHLPEAENIIWHAHPVWFLDGNPVAGYSKLKACVRVLFWSGQSFEAGGLSPEGSFKAAEARFTDVAHVDRVALAQWCSEARLVQWDYKNLIKRKGKLLRITAAPAADAPAQKQPRSRRCRPARRPS